MTSRLLSLFIWIAVAASATFWGLRLFIQPQPVPPQAVVAAGPAAAVGELSRLLGQAPVQAVAQPALVAAESRFKLVGVVAPRSGQSSGLALISVDGKAARTVGVGREVEPGLRLLAVSQRQADLGAGGTAPRMSLTLPMLAEANRGRPADLAGNPGGNVGQPAPPMPGALPGSIPGALLGQPGMAQRLQLQQQQQLQLQQQQLQLQQQQQQQQPGLPMRAMPSESAEEAPTPSPNPALR